MSEMPVAATEAITPEGVGSGFMILLCYRDDIEFDVVDVTRRSYKQARKEAFDILCEHEDEIKRVALAGFNILTREATEVEAWNICDAKPFYVDVKKMFGKILKTERFRIEARKFLARCEQQDILCSSNAR